MAAAQVQFVEVLGSNGLLQAPRAFAPGGEAVVLLRDGGPIGSWRSNQQRDMLAAFAEVVAGGAPLLPPADAVATARVLDRIALGGASPVSEVRAAGGVLWRDATDGGVEVALVHRPRYDDWSLPKGKLDPHETETAGALREVEEETGCRALLGADLDEVRYPLRDGREKVVRYYAMRALDGAFVPGREVDELRWVAPPQAVVLLTYDYDRQVLDRFLRRAAPS
jgi:8-oxo-dGTP diphosphatase